MGVQIAPCEGTVCRGKDTLDDTLLYAVLKWLKRLRCHLGLRWCAHLRHLVNAIEPSMCDGNVAVCQIDNLLL